MGKFFVVERWEAPKVFQRLVQVGRLCLINQGPDEGKLCVIIDVIDGTRALVDGPSTINGVKRQPINFKSLTLTEIVVPIKRGTRLHTLTKVWKSADIEAKWNKTSEARKLSIRSARANATDFDRFKLRHARRVRNLAIKK